MKTVGLIVEYNPLHNGHVYHCLQARNLSGADCVVAVMSGSFLQRGEPALVGKWARAEMALRAGVDLVLELPVAFSAQPAEWFAYGAVHALDATGVVDALCFGSEHGDIAWFEAMADRLAEEPDGFRAELRRRLDGGVAYPKAYAGAAEAVWGGEADAELMSRPNNTLGLHYVLALRRLGSRIRPLTIERLKAGFHDPLETDKHIASATAIRGMLEQDGDPAARLEAVAGYVPESTLAILRREFDAGRGPVRWDGLLRPLLAKIVTTEPERLADVAEVSEGLEHRLKLAAGRLNDLRFDALLQALQTKRYTKTKLQRMLVRILLGHGSTELSRGKLAAGVPGLRVLGFTDRGRSLLRRMRETAKVPVWTRIGREEAALAAMDVQAAAVYALGYPNPSAFDFRREFAERPVYVPDSAD